MLAAYRSPPMPDLPPLHGGLVGYLGYDVVREVEHLPCVPRDDLGLPDAVLSVIGSLAAFDHWRQRVYLVESVPLEAGPTAEDIDAAYDAAIARIEDAAARPRRAVGLCAGRAARPGRAAARREVDDGPRLVPTRGRGREGAHPRRRHLPGRARAAVRPRPRADPFDVYRVLRQVNPSPYMYFVRHPEVTIVGSSPEPMVQLLGGRVISRPIAGTRRRGATDEDDRRLGAELREHPKEIAEHVMLVDLARNDVGRVVRFGTEQVDEMMVLERYSHVMHLTSQVSGELTPGLGPDRRAAGDASRGHGVGRPEGAGDGDHRRARARRSGAATRASSATSTSRATSTPRSRSARCSSGRTAASVQAGAGIVADSDPAAEDEECWNKAKALLAAVPAQRRRHEHAGHD